jgi:cytochrome b subunit of formate dehydrogenase
MTGRVLRLALWVRIWHGMTALLFVVLAVTGIALLFLESGIYADKL